MQIKQIFVELYINYGSLTHNLKIYGLFLSFSKCLAKIFCTSLLHSYKQSLLTW